MSSSASRISKITFFLLSLYLVSLAVHAWSGITLTLLIASVLMFACCWASASHLFGHRATLIFVVISVGFGWFAEQMGTSYGWFFGQYHYTDVLGPRLMDVPIVIPLMWFALSYTAYVISNLIVWQAPIDKASGWGNALLLSFLSAMIVTAFDLGADPYLVYTLKAWIMVKTDGDWFGETMQGFVGWMIVTFVIVMGFRLVVQRLRPPPTPVTFTARHALVPLALYGANMVFQMIWGNPVEVRAIAAFAMGIPLLCAVAGFQRWRSAKRGIA